MVNIKKGEMKMIKKWKTLKSKQIFGNSLFGLREDTVKSPKTNNLHPVWIMNAPTWINIIPITKDKEVILIKQYRFGKQEITVEIPGGMLNKDENPKEAAIRELLEETGYTSSNVVQIGRVTPNPALMNNYTYSFLAIDVEKTTEQKLDDMEDIELLKVNLEKIPSLIKNQKIDHALVISAFYFLNNYLKTNSKI